jgi:hypothetical protein
MKHKNKLLGISALIIICLFSCNKSKERQWKKEDGYLSTEESAKQMAKIVWFNVYGSDIKKYEPFKARLNGRVWIVEGTLDKDKVGGVPYIEIQKDDGKILRVTHGK